jgi:hypothetical protein
MSTYPYASGWPTWPFTRLSPKAMAKLLKTIEGKRLDDAEEALL